MGDRRIRRSSEEKARREEDLEKMHTLKEASGG